MHVSPSRYVLTSLLLVLALVVAACGPAAATDPTPAPQATVPAAAPGAAPTPAAAAATPATGAATIPSEPLQPATITLWHGVTGAEEQAMSQVVQRFQQENQGVTVNMLAVPFDQLQNKFSTEASTGAGPDLIYGPKDWIGSFAQANLISPLDDVAAEVGLDQLNPAAVDAVRFQDQVWALPESTEAVALWYNTSMVQNPPQTSEELIQMAEEHGLAVNTLFYYVAGFIFGYGGDLFDDEQRCVIDEGDAAVQALEFVRQLRDTPNVIANSNTANLNAAFKDGSVGLIFEGPWASGDFAEALGEDNVAVAPPLRMAPGDDTFAPFLGTKNFFLSANPQGAQRAAALRFLNFITQPATQEIFAGVGHIPSNADVQVDSRIIEGFIAQTQSAHRMPNEPEMGAVWTPAGDMITKVLDAGVAPADAVRDACQQINQANNR
jgi:maltose-binding protein MalE